MTVNFVLDYKIIVLLFLYIFGVHGWGVAPLITKDNYFEQILLTIFIVSVILYIYKNREQIQKKYQIKVKLFDLLLAFIVILFLVAIGRKNLLSALTIDEIAYAWSSQLHAYVVFFELIGMLNLEDSNFDASILFHIISFSILISLIIAGRALLRISNQSIFIYSTISLLLFLRTAVSFAGGGESHHAPLTNLYYFTISTIFGPYSWSFRLATIIMFYIFLITLFSIALANVVLLRKLLITSLFFASPLTFQMLFTLEVSNWTFLVCSFLLVYIATHDYEIKSSLLVPVALLTYLRMNILIIFVCLLVSYVVQNRKKGLDIEKVKSALIVALPGVIMTLIFRVKRLDSDSITDISVYAQNWENVFFTISQSGSAINVILSASALCLTLKLHKKARLFISLYLFLNCTIFLVINANQFVSSKYLVEWLLPPTLLISGLLIDWQRDGSGRRILVYFVSAFMVLSSIFLHGKSRENFKELYLQKSIKGDVQYAAIPRVPLDFRAAYDFVKTERLNCLNVGPVYSTFVEILHEFSIRQIWETKKKRTSFLEIQSKQAESWLEVSSMTLQTSGLNCVMFGALNRESYIKFELQQNGWEEVVSFNMNDYGTTVFIFQRND